MKPKKRTAQAKHAAAAPEIWAAPALAPAPTHPRETFAALGAMAALALAMFGPTLLKGGSAVLGAPNTDMQGVFYAWRSFGFSELAKGNLALWNPYVFSGEPFFGGIQPGLLYPPNWLSFAMSIGAAVNWVYALHVWLLGALMYGWGRERGLCAPAAFFAGAILMFSGCNMPHIFAGHIPNVCTMAWAPAIFWAIDAWIARGRPAALLAGMAAVAMHVLGGHPQYVFYTALGAGFYALLRWGQAGFPKKSAAGLLTIYPGGAALVGLQLAMAVQANGEGIRASHLPWDFVSMFSLPPENFLTLLAPNAMGPIDQYWGRCYLWEMSLFIGATGLAMAALGLLRGGRSAAWPLAATLGLLWLLALGKHTPLLGVLYQFAPGFDKFRGLSKFAFPAALMLTMLAGMGLDALFRGAAPARSLAVVSGATAAVLLAGGCWMAMQSPQQWSAWPRAIAQTNESYLNPAALANVPFLSSAKSLAARSLLLAGASSALVCAGLAWPRNRRKWAWGLTAFGVGEVFVHGWSTLVAFDPALAAPPQLKQFFDERPGDYRVLNLYNPNSQMLFRKGDIWGGDPNVGKRYGEFIAWTQGLNPDEATQNVNFTQLDPLYALVRLRYAVTPTGEGFNTTEAPTSPLPHALLVSKWREPGDRDAIFAAMRAPGFEPSSDVLLESAPNPAPGAGAGPIQGSARVIEETGDTLTVEAETDKPAILVVTDLYTPAWRAVALAAEGQSKPAQEKYEVMPADYILRAVPLAPGKHRLRFEYAPPAFAAGLWISALALAAYAAAWAWLWRRGRLKNAAAPGYNEASARTA